MLGVSVAGVTLKFKFLGIKLAHKTNINVTLDYGTLVNACGNFIYVAGHSAEG